MKMIIAPAYQQYAEFIAALPTLCQQGKGALLYQQRNVVRRFEHDGVTMVVKQFKKVNAIQQVVYTFFRKTKAQRAFLFAGEFRRRDIETPHEIAYIETFRHGLFTTGYFVCEECTWGDAAQPLRETKDFDLALGHALMRHVLTMHQRGVLHGDLNLTNFLYRKSEGHDGGYEFKMIDINRSHFTDGMPTDQQCLENLIRLTHRRDLYEFLVGSYALQRGWDADATKAKALALLDHFEHRRLKL